MHESNATNNNLCNILDMCLLFQKISAMTREEYNRTNHKQLVRDAKDGINVKADSSADDAINILPHSPLVPRARFLYTLRSCHDQ